MSISVEFIKEWQTLIGSALGPFLAIILSAAGLLIKEQRNEKKKKKEATRRVEVSLTQTINRLYNAERDLKRFTEQLTPVINAINTAPGYAFAETSFPSIMDIYYDTDLSKMKFSSSYVHNKILMSEETVQSVNHQIKQFRSDFLTILSRREFLIQQEAPYENQRESYSQSLGCLKQVIEHFSSKINSQAITLILQTKIYNLKLRKAPIKTIWRYETIWRRYLTDYKNIDKYKDVLKSVDRIDHLIQPDVDIEREKALERARQFEQQAP